MIDAPDFGGQLNRRAVRDDRARRLEEQHRLVGYGGLMLGGVRGVVPPDADQLAGHQRRQERQLVERAKRPPRRAGVVGERVPVPHVDDTVYQQAIARPGGGCVSGDQSHEITLLLG